MGRLDYVKGIDATLEFIKLLFIRGVKFEFDFYGPDEGELYKIEDFIKENPKINVAYKGIIMPWEVNDKLIQYDFFVQFSKFEGMAMSVVEAMQIGVVPVVTSVGEIRDYASHLFNAIILSSTAQQDLISVVEVIENIVDNEALFRRISSNAAATFRNEPNYIESLSNILMNF